MSQNEAERFEKQLRVIFGNVYVDKIDKRKFNFQDMIEMGYSIKTVFIAIKAKDLSALENKFGFIPGHAYNLTGFKVTSEKLRAWQVLMGEEKDEIAEIFELTDYETVQVPALARISIYIRGQLNQLPVDSDGDLRCLDIAYFSGFREEDIVQLTDTNSGEVIHKQEKDVPDGQQVGFFKRPEAGWASTYKMVLLLHRHGNISTSTALNGTGQSNESMSIQELSTSNIEMETSNKM